MKILFGCHNFINSQPILYPLIRRSVQHNLELIFGPPAYIADLLKNGRLDAAFIPSIEYIGEDYILMPNCSISSKGKVESVILFAKTRIEDIKSVAVDIRSRTSVIMLKIILHKRYNIIPALVTMDPDIDKMLSQCDAALIIGDDALRMEKRDRFYSCDLGAEWYAYTGAPFVHAVIAARGSCDLLSLSKTIKAAKEQGKADIADIAMGVSISSGLSYEICLNYLTNIIRYDLGKDEIEALKRFYSLASEYLNIRRGNTEINIYEG